MSMTAGSPSPTARPSRARASMCRADRCSRTYERRSKKTARQAALPSARGRLRLSYACVRTARSLSLFTPANLYAAAGLARRLSEDGGGHRTATRGFRATQRLWRRQPLHDRCDPRGGGKRAWPHRYGRGCRRRRTTRHESVGRPRRPHQRGKPRPAGRQRNFAYTACGGVPRSLIAMASSSSIISA
jgi:hypothetical protein